MYEIMVEGGFSATHRLRLAGGEFEPLHGHDWRVSVRLAAEELDETGTVADFRDVQTKLNDILSRLHHTDLNEHPWLEGVNPTAEQVAGVIFSRLARDLTWGHRLKSVHIGEAPGCQAGYVPD